MHTPLSRRQFLEQTAKTAAVLPLLSATFPTQSDPADVAVPDIHIFSKHLQFLNYADMADAAANMGFAGVDLTVRPGGHVVPERVEDDLPKAVDALRKVNLAPNLMTTAVGDATNPIDNKLLKTAAKLGFKTYRMVWYQYDQKTPIPDSIRSFGGKIQALAALNKNLQLTGCYQNHAGLLIGSSVWEIWELLKTADSSYMGVQYDIRHATVEGGQSWPNGLRLVLPQLKAITLKDFHWGKAAGNASGKWVVQDVPMGQGMIDFKTYFATLKQHNIRVPITLHIEYPMGGAEHGAAKLSIPQNELFAAMKRDMNLIKELWKAA
ncbi:TIM barrel protein [Spirosoma sp. BT702]|uniref:TIM barrel protein n=1 Tax=Spirosoma profusum TaxID=2771354 RepID=A0A926Y574_9BACT|nr:TIM barrel protein [Spirosoma profusum]MBD2704300.1 TIM barrel protein [Spirosoma profusum]